MKKKTIDDIDKCPVTFALDTFGDKWSLLILRDMVFKQKTNYGEFLQSPEQISTNILANRLLKLENDGLIVKSRDPNNSVKFIYRLTDKGADLVPLMLEIIRWSTSYNPQPGIEDHIIEGAPAKLLERLDTDRPALIAEIIAQAQR